MTTDH